MPVTDTPPVTPAVPALPMPERLTVLALSVRPESALLPPMSPVTLSVPALAVANSRNAPPLLSMLLPKLMLPLVELSVAFLLSVTGPP